MDAICHQARGCAALALAAGVDLKVIQLGMGDASPVTTAETSIHVFRKMAREAVRASAALLLSHAKIRTSLEGALKRGSGEHRCHGRSRLPGSTVSSEKAVASR
ncbi:hypothetical protein ABZ436_04775 [Micromonospora matsumotoense]|uniref:hypothetical protein n=1 Tax=Micromonospora matsumotoense TaxID=121616 RepID=UPI0033FA04CE